MAIREELNGQLLRLPKDRRVYLIDRGRKRHVAATGASRWGGLVVARSALALLTRPLGSTARSTTSSSQPTTVGGGRGGATPPTRRAGMNSAAAATVVTSRMPAIVFMASGRREFPLTSADSFANKGRVVDSVWRFDEHGYQ